MSKLCKNSCIIILSFVLSCLFICPKTYALDPKYKRNGEVYLLIGGGNDSLVGIYRFNDPEHDRVYLPDPPRYLDNTQVNNAIGFFVDLNRHLYPFNEQVQDPEYPLYIYRQVVDNVDFLISDYGHHAYQHTDNRYEFTGVRSGYSFPSKGAPLYRSNINRPGGFSGTPANYTFRGEVFTDLRPIQYDPNCNGNILTNTDRRLWKANQTLSTGAGRYRKNNVNYYIWSLGVGQPSGKYGVGQKPDGGSLSVAEGYPTDEYPGKQWYKILNGHWYSSWHTDPIPSNRNRARTSTAYPDNTGASDNYHWTIGDLEERTEHRYIVDSYANHNAAGTAIDDDFVDVDGTNHNYKPFGAESETVGTTYDITIQSWKRNSCLDGCGTGTGGSSMTAPRTLADVGFQPALNGSTGNRKYFYTRNYGSTAGNIKLNGSNYNPSSSYQVFGYKDNETTEWIGISLKDVNGDYVYCLGQDVINEWYKQKWGYYINNPEITAVSVSNQWRQIGGIVFAYDRRNKNIYKFVRDDTGGCGNNSTHIGIGLASAITEFKGYPTSSIPTQINSYEPDVDDIKADGFGSLYVAMSYPSTDLSIYYPPDEFKETDACHIHCDTSSYNSAEDTYDVSILFVQKYGKAVFKHDYQDPSDHFEKINQMSYAYSPYHIDIIATTALKNLLLGLGNGGAGSWFAVIRNYCNDDSIPLTERKKVSIGGVGSIIDDGITVIQPSMFSSGKPGYCTDYDVPANATVPESKLGVINVPTPDEVSHIGPYKVSYTDICGPYLQANIPVSPETQHTADLGYNQLENETAYFYMVENYPTPIGNGSHNPNLFLDNDIDTRAGGFVSSIVNANPASDDTNPGTVHYQWRLWMVENPYASATCELCDDDMNGTYQTTVWQYTKSKFILASRVYYDWYDYDRLEFGSTIASLPEILIRDTYAWPSRTNMYVGGSLVPWNSPPYPDCYQMASTTDRLNEIMNLPEFQFMKPSNNPVDEEGNPINYAQRIIGSADPYREYWALEPLVFPNGSAPAMLEGELTASVERCDIIVDSNGQLYPPEDDYIFKKGARSHWSPPPSDTNTFCIEPGKAMYWRMAVASLTNLCYNINAKETGDVVKWHENEIEDSDFNIVAYLLANSTINGQANPLYVNSNPNLQFYPDEPGSCWWRIKKGVDGAGNPTDYGTSTIKISAVLYYPLSDGTIAKRILAGDANGQPENREKGSADLPWSPTDDKLLFASNTADLAIPPTDPITGTISIVMQREYYYEMHILDNSSNEMGKFKVGPIPLTLRANAKIRVLDTEPPRLVYGETSPVNLYGLTGRELSTSYSTPEGNNPPSISFTLRDNNPMEASNTFGINLDEHVRNYEKNFGTNAALAYVNGSDIMTSYLSGSNIEGIRQNQMNNASKSSDLNFEPLFSKDARDTRLIFNTATRNEDGSMSYGKADTKWVDGIPNTNNSIFNNDIATYAYNPGIKTDSYLNLDLVDNRNDATHGDYSIMKYSMALTDIKLSSGTCENIVPDGYANNTPGYEPYKFYVRATDCSGNYTVNDRQSDNNRLTGGNLLLNMALHVRDDIPPIPLGYLYDRKYSTSRYFPQEANAAEATDTTSLGWNITNVASGPAYFGMLLNDSLLRQEYWRSDNNTTGYFKDLSTIPVDQNYKALLSFCGEPTSESGLTIAYGNTVINNTNFVQQLRNGVTPYYVEDNVEILFKVDSSDNAGSSVASLTFKYYNSTFGNVDSSIQRGEVHSRFVGTGTAFIEGNPTGVANGFVASDTIGALFRAPNDRFPLAIPILIYTHDDAKDWDKYPTPAGSYGVTEPDFVNSPDKPCGSFKWDGYLIPAVNDGTYNNHRYFTTSLAVFKSGLDVRMLEKSLKNN